MPTLYEKDGHELSARFMSHGAFSCHVHVSVQVASCSSEGPAVTVP